MTSCKQYDFRDDEEKVFIKSDIETSMAKV